MDATHAVPVELPFSRGLSALSRSARHHLAIAAQIGYVEPPSKSLVRINSDLYSEPHVRDAITDLFNSTYSTYPPEEYGYTYAWEAFKEQLKDLMLTFTKDLNTSRRTKSEISSKVKCKVSISI